MHASKASNNKLNNISLEKMFLEIKQFWTLLLEALSTTCRAFVKLFLPMIIKTNIYK